MFIFLGIFFAVVAVVLVTVALALVRTWRAARARRIEAIRWHADFEDLPEQDRRCRHEIAGHVAQRICALGFDCRVCTDHPKIAAAAAVSAEPDGPGVPVPLDRMYHRGHTWVQPQPDGTLIVGLDELAKRLTGKPDEVDLPPVGSRVEVNGTGWKMRRFGAEVRLLSPLDGEVVAVGGPECDWFLKVKPSSFDLTHLLMGPEVKRWFVREMERLHVLLGAGELGPTLADGGAMLDDLPAANPRANWDAIWGGMFLEP